MTDELFRRVATYQATMALMKYVLKDRLINEDEYIRMSIFVTNIFGSFKLAVEELEKENEANA